MTSSIILKQHKLYIFSLLILLNYSINSYPYFSFPTAIALNNKNIFVIHETGITICDKTFKNIIKNVYNFTTEEQISTEEKLSKILIKNFDDGYIISVIIDRIYIFDEEGNFKFRTNSLISDITDEDIYLTLTAYIKENNYYYFFLYGYIYHQSLYLYYCKYDSSEYTESRFNTIAYIENYYEYSSSLYSSYKIINKGLSCEFLKYTYYDDLIVCGYYTNYFYNELSLAHFSFNGGTIQIEVEPSHLNSEDWDNKIECIKSSVTPDHRAAIYCFYLSNGKMFCKAYSFYYDYNNYYFYNVDCYTKY